MVQKVKFVKVGVGWVYLAYAITGRPPAPLEKFFGGVKFLAAFQSFGPICNCLFLRNIKTCERTLCLNQ